MDILEELDFINMLSPKEIYVRVGDVIVLERQLSDKLYRALVSLTDIAPTTDSIVKEALESYEMVRQHNTD